MRRRRPQLGPGARHLGLPRLGLPGIGVATSAVHLLSFLALYAAARRDPVLAPRLSLNAARADAATVRTLVGLGVPIAATYGSPRPASSPSPR
ncbi:hypothetical protein GCM10010341_33710 [Streptomyces noursei]|nr:hypothetical protein GCM10010341_33710 [Streptomyces noursei]